MNNSLKKLILGVGVWTVLFVFGVLPSLMADDVYNETLNIDQDPQAANMQSREKLQTAIEQMRAEIRVNGWNFTVGANPAMQYRLDELCGAKPDLVPPFSAAFEPGEEAGNQLSAYTVSSLPSSYMGYYTPIKDQGKCGSCWAFATIGNVEAAILKKTGGTTYDLSEQHLVSCNPWRWGCNGGGFAYDMLIPSMNYYPGAMLESCFPYTATDAKCSFCASPTWHPVDKWGYITNGHNVPSVDAIKNAIYTYGSVSVWIYADRTFQAYTGGVYKTNMKRVTTNHGVILCGWDDSKQAWRLKNSWGTGWGENGLMWIAYNCPNLVGQGASWVTTD